MIEKIKDDLYIAKGRFGYRIVYPLKKDLSKPLSFSNLDMKNLNRLLRSIVILLAVLWLFTMMYRSDTQFCQELQRNISQVCLDWNRQLSNVPNTALNLQNITLFPNGLP